MAKIKRFNKAQLASLRDSPGLVIKRKEAEAMFASPAYKAISKNAGKKKMVLKKSPKRATKK